MQTRTGRGMTTGLWMTVMLLVAGCATPEDGGDGQALTFEAHAELGDILVDAAGMTLYIFTNDVPGESRCYEQCATNWPPLVVEEAPMGPASIADRLGVSERTDGSMQATYGDRPLYYFVGDEAAGDANGDGLNGVWFVVRRPPSDPDGFNGQGSFEVEAENVTYHGDVTGYYARPADGGGAGGVVMIHEWWGLNDNIRAMADLLASHGYAVLAVDLFNGSVATTSEEAQQQVADLDQDAANANMRAAARMLRDEGATTVASLGWCFGGGQSLQLAISGERLGATVIYYGFLVTEEVRLGIIDWPVLGVFGESDQAIPVPQVRAFERALDNLSVENDIYIYPDVGHAFANPSGGGWSAEESQDAWKRTVDFLKTNVPPV